MRLTASKLPLLEKCTYFVRPDVPWHDGGDESARALGNAMHARAEAHVKGQPIPATPAGVDQEELELLWRPLLAWLERHDGAKFEAEVAFAYDLVTGQARRLPKGEHREYIGATETEVCGTIDLLGTDAAGILWVIDLKSGRSSLENYDAQLDGLGLMAARAEGRDEVHVTAYRPHAVGNDEQTDRWLDVFELDDRAAQLRIRTAPTDAEPRPGAWCTERYCPALAACPAQQAAGAELVPLTGPFTMSLAIESDEHAVWLRDRAKLVMEAAEQVLAAVKDYARASGGLPAGDGKKVWTEVPTTRSSIDGKAALALAERMGAPQEELAACMRSSVSKSFREVNAKGRAA